MERVKIGDVCSLKSGTSLKDNQVSESGKYPYVKVSDMNLPNNEKYITWSKQYTKSDISEKMVFPKDTVIFPKRGGAIGTNKKRITNTEICADLNVMGVTPNESIEPLYLYYYFQKLDFNTLSNGSSVPQINNVDIAPLEINLYSKKEQNEIINKLDKIDRIIALRKEQLDDLDELIKSQFVEMFGMPHEKRFETKTLPDITTSDKNSLKRGPFGGSLKKEDFVDRGYLVYEQRHAIHNDFEYEKYYITAEKYQEMIMFKVVPGDLLVSCSGVTLGRIAEVPQGAKEGIINQALLKISLNQELMSNMFFITLFRNEDIQDILFGFSRGSGIPNFPSMSEVKAVEFICPPIDLQNQFAIFVQQVDKLKFAVQKSLNETQLLFDSLMQKYFG